MIYKLKVWMLLRLKTDTSGKTKTLEKKILVFEIKKLKKIYSTRTIILCDWLNTNKNFINVADNVAIATGGVLFFTQPANFLYGEIWLGAVTYS